VLAQHDGLQHAEDQCDAGQAVACSQSRQFKCCCKPLFSKPLFSLQCEPGRWSEPPGSRTWWVVLKQPHRGIGNCIAS
jgi:hypothetical protein